MSTSNPQKLACQFEPPGAGKLSQRCCDLSKKLKGVPKKISLDNS